MDFKSIHTNNVVNDGIGCFDNDYIIFNEDKHLVLKDISSGKSSLLPFDGFFLNLRYPVVYFALKTDGFCLYEYNLLSFDCTKIVQGEVKWAQLVGDNIYYTLDRSNYLYSYSFAEKSSSLLLEQDCNYLCVVGDIIYFSNWSKGKALWAYNIITHDLWEVLDKDVAWINVIDTERLVFRCWHNRKTYSYHIKEKSLRLLNADGANYLYYRDGFIYYYNKRLGGLWRQSIINKRDKSCIYGDTIRRINSVNDYLLFQDRNKHLVWLPLFKIKGFPSLSYIEMIITTECNMLCSNCSNGIPYTDRNTISYQAFCEQLQSLLTHVSYIERFQLHGGEPFLNPEVHKMITFLDKTQKLLSIRVATNGTVIPNKETISALKGSRIVLAISSYYFNREKREQLIDVCKSNNIRYILYSEQEWYRFESQQGVVNSFETCPINSYPCYYEGKVYLCSRICHLYGKHYPNSNIEIVGFSGDLLYALNGENLKAPCRECTISNKKIVAGT